MTIRRAWKQCNGEKNSLEGGGKDECALGGLLKKSRRRQVNDVTSERIDRTQTTPSECTKRGGNRKDKNIQAGEPRGKK